MTSQSGVPTVLIADDDLAFVWWLGEVFADAGYQCAPALNCRQALALSKKLNLDVDLVVVNPHLAGAARMLQILALARPSLKAILIQNYGEKSYTSIQGEATLERPSGWESLSRSQWQRKLRGVLRQLEASLAH